MAIDSSLAVRKGILTLLKGNATLTAMVPAERIYSQETEAAPKWPFIRLGVPSMVPIRAACVDGASLILAVHAFAQTRIGGGVELETAEDYAHRIGATIASALDGQRLTLTNGMAAIRWTGSQLLQDPEEASAFHAVVNFSVRALTA